MNPSQKDIALFINYVLIFIIIILSIALFILKKVARSTQPTIQENPPTETEPLARNPHEFLFSYDVPEHNVVFEVYADSVVPYFYNTQTNEGGSRQELYFNEDIAQMLRESIPTSNGFLESSVGPILSRENVLLFEDVTFDGCPDIGLLAGVGYSGVNMYYTYYRCSPVLARDLDVMIAQYEAIEELSFVSNPTTDTKTQTVYSTYRDGPEWFVEEWKVEVEENGYEKFIYTEPYSKNDTAQ